MVSLIFSQDFVFLWQFRVTSYPKVKGLWPTTLLSPTTGHGTCYYCAPVWLSDQLSHLSWKKLNNQHYRALRVAVRDAKRKLPRALLNIISKRATPRQWAKYTTTSTSIKLLNTSNTRIVKELRKNHLYKW